MAKVELLMAMGFPEDEAGTVSHRSSHPVVRGWPGMAGDGPEGAACTGVCLRQCGASGHLLDGRQGAMGAMYGVTDPLGTYGWTPEKYRNVQKYEPFFKNHLRNFNNGNGTREDVLFATCKLT